MKGALHVIAPCGALALALSVFPADAKVRQRSSACTSSPKNLEVQALKKRIRDWAVTGWSQPASGPAFNFRKQLGAYYDWDSPDVMLFDNADPQHRVNRSAADYGAIWDAAVPTLKSLSNKVEGEPTVMICGSVAIAEVKFVTRFEMADGAVKEAPTLSSLVWRRTPTGWRIIREHGTAL